MSAATLFRSRPLLALPLALGANYEGVGWQRLVDQDKERFGNLSQSLYYLEGLKPLHLVSYTDDWKTLFQLLAYTQAVADLHPLLTTLPTEGEGMLAWKVPVIFASRPAADVGAHESHLEASRAVVVLPTRFEEEYYLAAYASTAALSQMLVLLSSQLVNSGTNAYLYDSLMKGCMEMASLVATSLRSLAAMSQRRHQMQGLSDASLGIKLVQPPATAGTSAAVSLVDDVFPVNSAALLVWAATARAQLAELWLMVYMNKEADASADGAALAEQHLSFLYKCACMAARCAGEYQAAFDLLTNSLLVPRKQAAKFEALAAGPQMQAQLHGTLAVKRYAYAAVASYYADSWKVSGGGEGETETRTFLVRAAARTLDALKGQLKEAEKNGLDIERHKEFTAMHSEWSQTIEARWSTLAEAASLLPGGGAESAAVSGFTLESVLNLQEPIQLVGFDNLLADEEAVLVPRGDALQLMQSALLQPLLKRLQAKTLTLLRGLLPANLVKTVLDDVFDQHRQAIVSHLLKALPPPAPSPVAPSDSRAAADGRGEIPATVKQLFAGRAMAFHALRRVGLMGREIRQLTRRTPGLAAWREQLNDRLLTQFTRFVNIVKLVFVAPIHVSLLDLDPKASSMASPEMTLDTLLRLASLIGGQVWKDLTAQSTSSTVALFHLDEQLDVDDREHVKVASRMLDDEINGARRLF
jgi:hypothetical protein